MNNKIWVLTYTIGTNEGRKQRRLTCDTKEQAEMQQAVLGGEVLEYIESPQSFKVVWPENIDVDGVLEDIRRAQIGSGTWAELYQCRVEPEGDFERQVKNDAVRELVVDEVSCLIDDMSNHSPGCQWEEPGSPAWDLAKVEALNNMRKLLNAIR